MEQHPDSDRICEEVQALLMKLLSSALTITWAQITSVLSWLLHMQEQRLRVQRCRLEDAQLRNHEPASATGLLAPSPYTLMPQEFTKLPFDEPDDSDLSPTDFAEIKTEVPTVAPTRRQHKHRTRTVLRRHEDDEALTEVIPPTEVELRRAREKDSKKSKRIAQQKIQKHSVLPETPSSARSQKEVYAEWGEPLQ